MSLARRGRQNRSSVLVFCTLTTLIEVIGLCLILWL